MKIKDILKYKPKKLIIGKEYDVQGQYAVLEAIEGDEAVCRGRMDNQFKVNIADVIEKKSFKNK